MPLKLLKMVLRNLRVASYNCRGLQLLRGSTSVTNFLVTSILENSDLVFLQEIFCYKQDMPLLNSFHSDFHGIGETVLSTSDGPHTGRPKGGVAILWRKSIESIITELKFDLDWAVGVQLSSNSTCFISYKNT